MTAGLFAADADDRVRQLTELTRRLTARLAEDARALETRRPQALTQGAAETLRLANLYRHECARVKADPGLVSGGTPALRAALLAATEAFEAVMARHGRALTAVRTVTEGLVQAIANEVAAQRPTPSGYGPGAKAPAADARAITLNRRA